MLIRPHFSQSLLPLAIDVDSSQPSSFGRGQQGGGNLNGLNLSAALDADWDATSGAAQPPLGLYERPLGAPTESDAGISGANTNAAAASSPIAGIAMREEVRCGCTDHLAKVMLDKVFPISLPVLHHLLFGEGSSFIAKLLEERKCSGLCILATFFSPVAPQAPNANWGFFFFFFTISRDCDEPVGACR
jgi:hypothetical protein